MQVAGSGIQVSNTVTPYSPPSRVTVSFASTQDLESTLPPVQPLEVTSKNSSSGSTPPLIYNRFAQLSQAPGSSGSDVGSVVTDESVTPSVTNQIDAADNSPVTLEPSDSAPSDQPLAPLTEPNPQQGRQGSAPDVPKDEAPDNGPSLSDQDLEIVAKLSARDREVRSHELAHLSVGGQFASAPQFSYERGPDGRNYAVGGEVSIDTGSVAGDPEASIRKLEQVRRAALAPAEPSSQDRSVAAQASQKILQAQAELAQQQQEEAAQTEAAQQESRQQEDNSSSSSAARDRENQAIQTYLDLIGLGEQLSGIGAQSLQLDEII